MVVRGVRVEERVGGLGGVGELVARGEVVVEGVHGLEPVVVHGEEEVAWGGLGEEVCAGEFGVKVGAAVGIGLVEEAGGDWLGKVSGWG